MVYLLVLKITQAHSEVSSPAIMSIALKIRIGIFGAVPLCFRRKTGISVPTKYFTFY